MTNTDTTELPPATAIDLDPCDDRVPEYEALFGDAEPRPLPKPVFAIQDQGAQRKTRMGCTRYGLAHAVNAQNSVFSQLTGGSAYDTIQGMDLWLEYLKENPAAEAEGATLLSALAQAKNRGLITEYAILRTIEEAKAAIDRGHFIYTGSLDGDWAKVRRDHVYGRKPGTSNGHIFCIVGYDESGFRAVNSYGESNGFFTIPYELFGNLYTRYAVIDKKDAEAVISYHNKVMAAIKIEDAKKAVDAGIWSGERPQDPATREEVAAMVLRMGQR